MDIENTSRTGRPIRSGFSDHYVHKKSQSGRKFIIFILTLGISLFIAYTGITLGADIAVFSSLWQMLAGNQPTYSGFSLPDILLIQGVASFLAFSLSQLVRLLLGNARSVEEMLRLFRDLLVPRLFLHSFFVLVLALPIAEELFFRGLLVGALGQIFPMVILVWVSNMVFAVLHLQNTEKADRNLLRILPQLVLGFGLAFIFISFGLLAAILAHALHNTLCVFLAIFAHLIGIRYDSPVPSHRDISGSIKEGALEFSVSSDP